MCDQVRQDTYLKIWSRIEAAYFGGYMVSEHGLQAALYAELQTFRVPTSSLNRHG